MANLFNVVKQQQTPSIDEEKLKIFCTRTNIWEYFGIERDFFSMLPENKQMQLTRKFYFDHLPKSDGFNRDSSIGNTTRNSANLSMKKAIESGEDRTQLSLSTINSDQEVKKSFQFWKDFGYFGTEYCDFSIKKANMPENLLKTRKKFTIMIFTFSLR